MTVYIKILVHILIIIKLLISYIIKTVYKKLIDYVLFSYYDGLFDVVIFQRGFNILCGLFYCCFYDYNYRLFFL